MSDLLAKVKEIYKKNHHEGFDSKLGLEYFFTAPAEDRYPFQWFWDSCFHAIVQSHFDIESAKRELRSLVQFQQPNGFMPHVIFWRDIAKPVWKELETHPENEKITAMVQPPMLALAVEEVYKKDGDKAFVDELLPVVTKFHDYLLAERDPDGDDLVSIIQSRESGLDWAPQYDELFGNPGSTQEFFAASDKIFKKYQSWKWDLGEIYESEIFDVEDLLYNVITIKALEAEDRLSGTRARASKIKAMTAAVIKKMWHEPDGTFYCLKGPAEKPLKVNTVSSLLPMWLELPEEIEEKLIAQIMDAEEFGAPHPVPCVGLDEAQYMEGEHRLIWRGNTWINTNWMLYRAFMDKGHTELAEKIKTSSMALVERSGFREYYDPFTGGGYGAKDFGWSTLVLDMK